MNLHAATTAVGRDRKQQERLCRYLLRRPFSAGAIERLPDGRVRLDIARKARSATMTAEQWMRAVNFVSCGVSSVFSFSAIAVSADPNGVSSRRPRQQAEGRQKPEGVLIFDPGRVLIATTPSLHEARRTRRRGRAFSSQQPRADLVIGRHQVANERLSV